MKSKNQFTILFSFLTLAVSAQIENKKTTNLVSQINKSSADHSIVVNTIFNSSCTSTLSNQVIFLDNSVEFKIYPNPIESDYFEILMPTEIIKIKVKITSLSGQKIKEEEVYRSNSKVFVGNLAKGLYLVELISGLEKLTFKVVKK